MLGYKIRKGSLASLFSWLLKPVEAVIRFENSHLFHF